MPKGTPLRSWLRRKPAPAKVRVRLEEGEERDIAIPGDSRNRWQTVETMVLNSGAVVVECLDAKGALMRSQRIEDTEEVRGDSERDALRKELESNARSRDDAVEKTQKGMAIILDRYADRLNEAFDRGAEAAGQGQDKLVGLVDTLTQHLTLAIANLHTVAANFASAVQAQGGNHEEQPQSQAMLAQLLGVVAAKAMVPAPAPVAASQTNNKGGKPHA